MTPLLASQLRYYHLRKGFGTFMKGWSTLDGTLECSILTMQTPVAFHALHSLQRYIVL